MSQWVREEDLAKALKLKPRKLRRTLRFLEEEKLVTQDHRKQTAKGAKIYNTHSYSCLDYAQIYDVVRYRLHRMKKMLEDELDNKITLVPTVGRDILHWMLACRLVSMEDEYFHCEVCNGRLVPESAEKLENEDGDGNNARRPRYNKLEGVLKLMEAQLKPLTDQLNRVKDLPVPEFGSLQAWEAARASAASVPSPFVGDQTKVEVAFCGVEEKGENIKSKSRTPTKMFPPGMKLTKEQSGDLKEEGKTNGASPSTTENNDGKKYEDEYLKQYYAPMLKRQPDQEAANREHEELPNCVVPNGVYSTSSTRRQAGMKSKRNYEDNDDESNDVNSLDWEEG